jgi:hypothetical protein
VNYKFLWRGALISALCVALAIPAQAQPNSLDNMARNVVIGIVAVSAALVVITVVIVHESRKKRTVTGCVAPGEMRYGMSVKDERDKQVYDLSGNTEDIKPGDRVTLQGKKAKPTGANAPLYWEVIKETKDFGPCQP